MPLQDFNFSYFANTLNIEQNFNKTDSMWTNYLIRMFRLINEHD